MEELNARGVVVVRRRDSRSVASAIAACHTELLESLARMLSLPQTMAERARPCSHRYMMPISTTRAFIEAPVHRSDFKLPFSPCIENAVRVALSGGAGAALLQALGGDAPLCELTAIPSDGLGASICSGSQTGVSHSLTSSPLPCWNAPSMSHLKASRQCNHASDHASDCGITVELQGIFSR